MTRTFSLTAGALAAAALLGLAGCAVPYPVAQVQVAEAPRYEAPRVEVAPRYEPAPRLEAPRPVRRDNGQRDYRRQRDEQLFEADVISARAVMGQVEQQRCWVEREQVSRPAVQPNVPGALIGAVIGGVIGHQIGGGTGRDIATAGGVVVGAVVGSNVGRDRFGNTVGTRDVQRCSNPLGRAEPAYWDVRYAFRGVAHRVQLDEAPGRSITVNRDGEPRE